MANNNGKRRTRGNNNRNNNRNNQHNNSNGNKVTESAATFSVAINDAVATDFGNFNYSYLPGSTILDDLAGNYTAEIGSIPGVMAIPVIPTIGKQNNSSTDPINLAAQKIYTNVRKDNSGAKNYDQNNLMIHIMAMDSVYSYHAYMWRIYGLLTLFSTSNFYVPRVLAEAMNIDIDDLYSNYAVFRGYINLFARRAEQLVVPDVLPIIKEHSYLFNRVYTDHNTILGQMYIFKPYGFYHYVENSSSGNKFGTLQFQPIEKARAKLKYSDLVAYGNMLLEDILNSEDMALMSGDLKKAYSDSMLLTMPMISEDYTIELTYDEDVLLAIHNANFIEPRVVEGSITNLTVGPITAQPTNNNLVQSITYTGTKYANGALDADLIGRTMLLDQHKEHPSVDDNYIATRFKFSLKVYSASISLDTYGLELLLSPQIWYFDADHNIESENLIQTMGIPSSGEVNVRTYLKNAALNSYFEMSPIIYFGTIGAEGPFASIQDPIPMGELYNPTLVDTLTFKNMLTAYLMILFGV